MPESEEVEQTISLPEIVDGGITCPFSRGKWKRAGDALVLFMLFVMPILYLVVFLLMR